MSEVLPESHPEHPFNLIPELCRNFYRLGWATGTGGGISVKMGDLYYVAPSGVQKERIQPDDIFVLNDREEVVAAPRSTTAAAPKSLKISECTPLFFRAYAMRNAGACLHSHSPNAVLATLLFDKEFTISHLEMIKGVRNAATGVSLNFSDTLVVPIIENTSREADLKDSLAAAIAAYPAATAVLVRQHGIYVWGATWQQAKGAAECIDYLMGLAIQMKSLGIAWPPKKE